MSGWESSTVWGVLLETATLALILFFFPTGYFFFFLLILFKKCQDKELCTVVLARIDTFLSCDSDTKIQLWLSVDAGVLATSSV